MPRMGHFIDNLVVYNSILPLVAIKSAIISILPPASRTNKSPAAISAKSNASDTNPSNLPAATHAKSSAGHPVRRTSPIVLRLSYVLYAIVISDGSVMFETRNFAEWYAENAYEPESASA